MMGLQARVLRSARRRIVAHLRATRTQARVEPAQGLFNFRCHENCVQWVCQRPDEDLDYIHAEFTRSLDHWLRAYVPWWGRVLLGIERCL